MYLDRIRLKNLRGFDVLDFSFLRSDATFAGWTVITGDNGSGKSTLLKAIALALVGPDAARGIFDGRGWICRYGSDAGRPAFRRQAGLDHDIQGTCAVGDEPYRKSWSEELSDPAALYLVVVCNRLVLLRLWSL